MKKMTNSFCILLAMILAFAAYCQGFSNFGAAPLRFGSGSAISKLRMAKSEQQLKEALGKGDLLNLIQQKTEYTKADIDRVVKAFFEVVKEEVVDKGRQLRLQQFGTFRLTKRAARSGRNPQTGAALKIPASQSLAFSSSKAMKKKGK